ncbi:marvel-containing potential lipid raft-associated protein [Echinococcus granulosus]|uniref:Marvel-containing potential lipid raft-associated protein n=1 Tax=Echinococcus granulosus TaxID=6210 RepID=W6UXF9_ECHGR|nr:marvel-containing potential lipid raft-associated protein [Echinococcus granulosus]EUB58234.1 marvel-containing potential lipid raft-associated protein [Echinococcus granulosus]
MERQVYQTTSEWDDPAKDRFKYNPAFLRDKHGIFKIIEIILTICAFICVGSHFTFRDSGSGGWINFTLSLSLIISLFFFFGYLFNLIPFLPGPWAIIDFVCQCLLAFLILISMIVAAAFSPYSSAAIAAALSCQQLEWLVFARVSRDLAAVTLACESNASFSSGRLVFCAFLSLCYLIETLIRFSVKREGDRMVITTHGVFRSSTSGGAAFQRAPTEPATDGYGMP